MIEANRGEVASYLRILSTREAILDLGPALEALAERCGQAGAMHWLPYFLDRAVTRFRAPILVLRVRRESPTNSLPAAGDLEAAAMFFEYRFAGVRTGAVATADAVGFSSVIAPQGQRLQLAAEAARALLESGAAIVLATCEGDVHPGSVADLAEMPGTRFALRERVAGRSLRLRDTVDSTLAQMGKSTRFNLRYYRRRTERDLGGAFVAEAAPELRGVDLRALNAASLNPVAPAEFERRVRCATELPGSFLAGLRAADGRWLSLVGGWRQAGTTVLHWQMNSAGFERYSLCTAMRSFLLEHEVGRGALELLIYGGTSHPMHHAFRQDAVVDLVAQRNHTQAALLRWAARFVATPDDNSQKGNFLASLLRDQRLEWRVGTATEAGQSDSGRKLRAVAGRNAVSASV